MELSIQDLLTVGGSTVLVVLLMAVISKAITFDTARFGALVDIVLGVIVVALANVSAVADVKLGWGEAILTGVLAGAAASGLYDAGKGAMRGGGGG